MNYGKLYDEQVAQIYDKDEYGLLQGVRSLAVSQILESGLPQKCTVLDLGVGTGESLVALRHHVRGGHFIGVDLSAKMLESAVATNPARP